MAAVTARQAHLAGGPGAPQGGRGRGHAPGPRSRTHDRGPGGPPCRLRAAPRHIRSLWIFVSRWANLAGFGTQETVLASAVSTLRSRLLLLLLATPLVLASAAVHAQGFKFSQPDDADQQAEAEAARARRIADQLSTPCRAELRNRKIMVMIGEIQSNGVIAAQQQNYGPHFEAINARLRALGLRTYTPEEIRRQIAQAEIDAVLRNDPDAALAASKRLGASFVLRGLISSTATGNPLMAVNQVAVNMGFRLTGADGRHISEASAQTASYAGADVQRMALTLVNENADEVVARLYADYCRNAAPAARGGTAPNR